MISLQQVLKFHRASLSDFGGGDGIRDQGSLESAIARPCMTFGDEELYPTPIEKAAAIGESIIMNHPFVDANKRTGFLAMLAVLDQAGLRLVGGENERYDFVVAIASGKKPFEEIVECLKENTVEKE